MKKFHTEVDKFNISKIIRIDETSIHDKMKYSCSRCDLGKRCVNKNTDNKVFRKSKIVYAISNNKVVE